MKSFQDFCETVGAADVVGDEDREAHLLSGQIKTLLTRMQTLISRMKNKNKGYEILGEIGKSVQDAMGITDFNARKAVLGQMPQQRQQ